MGLSYITGNQYCVFSISKKEAEHYGIDNSEEVEIKATKNGIVIQRKEP
jgi:hypothetical protein